MLCLQAGTYIKVIVPQCHLPASCLQKLSSSWCNLQEFVHSDEGRTQPHLAGLLGCSQPARILQLDVEEVHMSFP